MAEQPFNMALSLYSKGQLVQARNLYIDILQESLENREFALNMLGLIEFQFGNFEKSRSYFSDAIALRWNFKEAHNNMSVVLKEMGLYSDAENFCENAIELDSKYVDAYYNLAIVFERRGFLGKAVNVYKKIISIKPEYVEAYNNLGVVLCELGQVQEARQLYHLALSIQPDFPHTYCNIGGIFLINEEYDQALVSFNRALKLKPDYSDARIGFSKTLLEMERLKPAEVVALEVVKNEPKNAKAYAVLACIYSSQEKLSLAENSFEISLSLDASCLDALVGYGRLCMENGKIDKAINLLEKAIQLQPSHIPSRLMLSELRKATLNDENLTYLQSMNESNIEFVKTDLIAGYFALGKCFDDVKQYSLAFESYLNGAQLKRSTINYDPTHFTKKCDLLIDFFTKERMASLEGFGDESDKPIFVLGMPRSGTTLTEQIIASHPKVYGAGELNYLLQIIGRHSTHRNSLENIEHALSTLNIETIRSWGQSYLAELLKINPTLSRVTDKMPANFVFIGFIHLMLPNAKIIHVVRNPVDTCLSCFTRLFKKNALQQTYDLVEIGKYYVDYHRLMEHWRKVLPKGSFYEVRYENIVSDQETHARKLLEYCELPWDNACLSFYETSRNVRTASLAQVRQPIYSKSVERWRAYEEFLSPLLNVLGELVPSEGLI